MCLPHRRPSGLVTLSPRKLRQLPSDWNSRPNGTRRHRGSGARPLALGVPSGFPAAGLCQRFVLSVVELDHAVPALASAFARDARRRRESCVRVTRFSRATPAAHSRARDHSVCDSHGPPSPAATRAAPWLRVRTRTGVPLRAGVPPWLRFASP